jgi:thiol-disulfide isomerase/thioredoxin
MENEPQADKASPASRGKIAVLVIGVVAVGAVMALTNRNPQQCGCLPPSPGLTPPAASPTAADFPEERNATARPRLLDLGAGQCIPCKMMAPVLDELKTEYEGRLDVVFIDVWQNPDAASKYEVQTIPTQIFFDASGKEVHRHTGFFAKEDILKKWQELGINFKK